MSCFQIILATFLIDEYYSNDQLDNDTFASEKVNTDQSNY